MRPASLLCLLTVLLVSCGDVTSLQHQMADHARDAEIERLERELYESRSKECPEDEHEDQLYIDEVGEIDQ